MDIHQHFDIMCTIRTYCIFLIITLCITFLTNTSVYNGIVLPT